MLGGGSRLQRTAGMWPVIQPEGLPRFVVAGYSLFPITYSLLFP
jgi:hypothetical protein